MPELPELEITARLLDEALEGAVVESTLSPGINALRTFQPPLRDLHGRAVTGVTRRGKHLLVHAEGGLHLVFHLMGHGRLQLFEQRAGLKDKTSRVLVRLEDGRELRLREFGKKHAAWLKLLDDAGLAGDESLATLGPEAWPDPPAGLGKLLAAAGARPLYSVLRDQRVIAGIGRSWVDEILWTAQLSPFKRATELTEGEAARLRDAMVQRLGDAVDYFAETLALPLPDKITKPLLVHRHAGEPCPRCGTTLEAVHYEDYVMCYCPNEQTEGRVLKDRRLSRLLK